MNLDLFEYNESESAIDYAISNNDKNIIFSIYGFDGLLLDDDMREYYQITIDPYDYYRKYFIDYINQSVLYDLLYKTSFEFIEILNSNEVLKNSVKFDTNFIRNETYSYIKTIIAINKYDICVYDKLIRILKKIDFDYAGYNDNSDEEDDTNIYNRIVNFIKKQSHSIYMSVKNRNSIAIKIVPINRRKYRKFVSKITKCISKNKYYKTRNECYIYYDKIDSDDMRNIINISNSMK